MKKRGDITFNTIIIAALALLVHFVLVIIFTGKMNLFSRSTECAGMKGECLSDHDWDGCPMEKPISVMAQNCKLVGNGNPAEGTSPGQCCIPLG